jgi:hypothetical protein
VRHATAEDLARLEPLLAELRALPQLRERSRGTFPEGPGRLFHEDAGDLHVDVRLDSTFQRFTVTNVTDQADFLARVKSALRRS